MENDIYNLLIKQNSWWLKEKVDNPKAFLPRRFIFDELADLLNKPRILALIGPRRTGKTVLLFQLIRYLLEEKKINPENVGYLLCDDPEVELYLLNHNFGSIIDVFLQKKEEAIYLFLDEVQYLDKWALWLKKYQEFTPNIKFIISGSSALHLQKGSRESLVGRLLEKTILTLSFPEYVSIKNTITGQKIKTPEIFRKSYFSLCGYLSSHPQRFFIRKKVLSDYFDDYLLYGGFPEGIAEKDINLWQEYLKEDVIKRQIYHDIVKIFKIENPSLLENLLFYIGVHTGSIFSFETFLNALPFGSKETVVNYLSYLKETFLLESLPKLSKKALIKKKKYFLRDTGIINMIVKRTSLLGEKQPLGCLTESIAQNHAVNKGLDCFFYRDDQDHEVDLIIKQGKTLIPVEVKFSPKPDKKDLTGLLYFMKKENIKKGIVVTGEKLSVEKINDLKVYYLPIWEFLYNDGI